MAVDRGNHDQFGALMAPDIGRRAGRATADMRRKRRPAEPAAAGGEPVQCGVRPLLRRIDVGVGVSLDADDIDHAIGADDGRRVDRLARIDASAPIGLAIGVQGDHLAFLVAQIDGAIRRDRLAPRRPRRCRGRRPSPAPSPGRSAHRRQLVLALSPCGRSQAIALVAAAASSTAAARSSYAKQCCLRHPQPSRSNFACCTPKKSDRVEHLALVLGAEPPIERLRLHLFAVDVVVLDLRVALLLAPGEGDVLVVALAAVVLVQFLAREQAVAAAVSGGS